MKHSHPSRTTAKPDHGDFAGLMNRWQNGSEQAAQELYERFGPQIITVVRRMLDERLRRRYDSEDFAQAVWASFFGRTAVPEEFQEPRQLVRFLSRVARNKLWDARRRPKREPVAVPFLGDNGILAPAARVPTPSQEAIAGERWQQMLADQPEYCRQILCLLREGRSHDEIAAEVGLTPKIIQRLLQRLSRGRGSKS